MSDIPDLRTELAAYLAGDLDDDACTALEARLDSEPWVARELDRMADLAVELGGVDDVEPPAGFSDRLRSGLSEAIGHELPHTPALDEGLVRSSGAAAASGWSTPRGRDDTRRPAAMRRRDRRRSALAVAAAVAVLFIGSTAVLLSGTGEDSTMQEAAVGDGAREDRSLEDEAEDEGEAFAGSDPFAAGEATEEADDGSLTEAEALQDAPAEQEEAEEAVAEEAEEAVEEEALDEAASPTATGSGDTVEGELAPPQAEDSRFAPAVLDLRGLQPDDEVLRDRVATHPAATSLLDRDADEAAELADPYRDELLRDPTFPEGTPPGLCLVEVLRDAGEGVVPTVSALFGPQSDGSGQSLAFALARSSDGTSIDTIDVWVVDVDDCGVLAVVS